MSLINPAILWGFLVVAIPVVLHLLLRSKPKKYLFPALQLVRVRKQNNVRRLRLKHLWLLFLRMAVLALLVAAIARPTLPAANYQPTRTEWLTTAGILAVALGVYHWLLNGWKRERLPNHVLSYRRTLLRGGTALAGSLAFLVAVLLPYGHRIAAEISAPLPSVAENLPVAAVFLFDSSLSMSYKQRNLTRLEEAQNVASAHLGRLPQGSRVAVADTSSEINLVFQAENSGALDRIQKIQPKPLHLPLATRVRAAFALQEEDMKRTLAAQGSVPESRRRDHYLREVYLFTDLTASDWRTGDFDGLKRELERLSTVQLYIIDVGVEHVTNASINALRLSSQSVPKGTELTVEGTTEVTGFEREDPVNIELHLQNENGQLVKREQRTLKPSPGKPASASFNVGGLTRPITHGELRLVSSDPYAVDDVRYFTVAVVAPVEVLVVGESRSETVYVAQALAPTELVRLGKARYHVRTLAPAKVDDAALRGVDVVILVNAALPSRSIWSALGDYVRAGAGLLVVAGNERLAGASTLNSYNSEVAQAFLPAQLTANVKLPEPATLDLKSFDHPLFRKFEFFDGGFGELATAKIYRRWGAIVAKRAGVVATYTDPRKSPAIIERPYGAGRTVLITTGLDNKGWSNLPLVWQFVALMDQLGHYLSRQSEAQFNYVAGEDVSLPFSSSLGLHNYLLRKPGLEQLPGEIPPNAKEIVIRRPDQLGGYDVVSRNERIPFSSGFSVNAPESESNFTRISMDELERKLGKGRFSVARSIEGLTRNVAFGRVGQEVFSLILGVVIAAFCAEHFVANRFYESEQAPEHR